MLSAVCYTFSLSRPGRLSTSTSSPILPAPTLDIYLRSKDAVVLVCEVPRGQRGVLFMLYRLREEVFECVWGLFFGSVLVCHRAPVIYIFLILNIIHLGGISGAAVRR